MRGRSTFARLQLVAFDVGAQMASDPIYDRARAAVGESVPDPDAVCVVSRGRPGRSGGLEPWSAGAGDVSILSDPSG